jgi:hypothetical protein
VNIKYSPLKETIIHEISIFRSALEMAKTYTAGMFHSNEQFKWASGVAINYRPLEPSTTDLLAKEFLKGRTHWEWVSIAPMPKYNEIIKISTNASIPVKDVSYNARFVEIGRFLAEMIKANLKENKAYPLVAKSIEMEK